MIDLMQLVRVIQVGMDVDGDWASDIDPTRIYYLGASAGTMMGASFVALDPAVSVAAFVSPPQRDPRACTMAADPPVGNRRGAAGSNPLAGQCRGDHVNRRRGDRGAVPQ